MLRQRGRLRSTQPDQGALRRKVGHIDATGAQLLATANPGCHLQIAGGLETRGFGLMSPIRSLLASGPARGEGKRDEKPPMPLAPKHPSGSAGGAIDVPGDVLRQRHYWPRIR